MKNVTLKDVAAAAGVSRASAARVLGDYGYASDTVRNAVLRAAEELEYAPSKLARAMRNGRTQLLGFICADISDGLFSQALAGICRVAEPAGYQVVVFTSSDQLGVERDGVSALLSHGVEGLIVSPVIVEERSHLADATVPVVYLDRAPEDVSGVVSDNVGAGSLAAQLLVNAGHRRIGMTAAVQTEEPIVVTPGEVHRGGGAELSVHGADRPSVLRVRGFVKTLQEKGVRVEEDDLLLSPHRSPDAQDRLTAWLRGRRDLTAIAAVDSYQARSLYRAVGELGMCVPEDLSIVVFSDDDWVEFTRVPLTTIQLDGVEMGARAAEKLLAALSEEKTTDATVDVIPVIRRAGASIAQMPATSR
ncbi:LacI family transcriptional regulator [Brevibacterium sp. 50QC2O2]|uniref:LacI family DNA-binding transcriptional regulator n=1 Tax=unclassified Brevibacterium TaxID=2614124 RepID=UPI00211CCA23|nr:MULTISPECIES: LacI family DNA-binding transcriptional regulator [unclassified Brevibacterium]MCQ9368775.1 LacI family transcriptional regulator [Brevibacterium sp. 91QC2O2]MCQ9388580.1 LacI family transcriptional regulator [Brevibacterium sp. 50QC2O2]